jgi:hypothetical protein
MNTNVIIRILCSLVLFTSILIAPWWTSTLIAVVLIVAFRWYIEGVVLLLCADLYYGGTTGMFPFRLFLFGVFVFLISYTLHRQTKL